MHTYYAIIAILASTTLAAAQTTRPTVRPNVVLIVLDDLGYNDVGFHGGPGVKTPNIDAIAAGGTRFANAYVSCPVCSPTRAGLMTGRYQQRFGHEQNPLPTADGIFGLPLEEKTIADDLKAAGYKTGIVGKWHLGNGEAFRPGKRGFDEFFGFLGGAHRYINLTETGGPNAIRRGDTPTTEPAYLTDAFNREAAAFIDRHHDEPFFLFLPFNAVHTPQQVPPKYRDRFAGETDDKRMRMLAMLSAADDGVGAVTNALKKYGLEDDTLIFVMSDNGGPPGNGTRNTPLRGFKGETLEGGIRVPFVIRWPAKVPAGKVEDRPVIQLDVLPTVLAATGAKSLGNPLDGKDLLPFLDGRSNAPIHDALYWRFGPRRAIRSGDWKLHWNGDGERSLYNLSTDPGESTNVAANNPTIVEKLKADWATWNSQLAEPRWPGRLEGGGNGGDGLTTAPTTPAP